ncbi:hypothetical protein BH23ACT10_BH23ACT10_34450 [soil metagenome]
MNVECRRWRDDPSHRQPKCPDRGFMAVIVGVRFRNIDGPWQGGARRRTEATMADHRGDVFTWPRLYDWLSAACSGGRRRRIDQRAAELLAPYSPGRLLDVGCGTGALTIALRRRYPDSAVIGVDPGAGMVARARDKAARAGLDIDLRQGYAQDLPVPDDSVDAVTISLALHHVPDDAVPAALAETRRVLRPGGVLLLIEIAPATPLARILSLHAHGDPLAGSVPPCAVEGSWTCARAA